MPRRTEPKRELNISIDKESVQEALAQWVNVYHGIKIDPRTIEFDYDSETKQVTQVRAIKKPSGKPAATKSVAGDSDVVVAEVAGEREASGDNEGAANQEQEQPSSPTVH